MDLPQGIVISTIRFNIFINDLPGFLSPAVNSVSFANDLVLWDSAVKKNPDSLSGILNPALEKLAIWCRENGMKVNKNKTGAQFFTLNRHTFTPISSSRERFCRSVILPPISDVFLIPA
ncbi:hypothetical protein TNCT_19821 [Trichonephila clavata]|uniref:Reverse transcriptase domain-containing protein n=1 Tax=Trichonephila clavata TaxID=2740835 RepID=A0A8X6GAL9_TRICU|nr:hypothetical protein TNCT_19821 [Trichonephila clavata]